jgi:hypothetical protein
MTRHRNTQTRLAQQIAVCDDVLGRLTELDDPTLKDLIEDVRTLRASLREHLASLDGKRSPPST